MTLLSAYNNQPMTFTKSCNAYDDNFTRAGTRQSCFHIKTTKRVSLWCLSAVWCGVESRFKSIVLAEKRLSGDNIQLRGERRSAEVVHRRPYRLQRWWFADGWAEAIGWMPFQPGWRMWSFSGCISAPLPQRGCSGEREEGGIMAGCCG